MQSLKIKTLTRISLAVMLLATIAPASYAGKEKTRVWDSSLYPGYKGLDHNEFHFVEVWNHSENNGDYNFFHSNAYYNENGFIQDVAFWGDYIVVLGNVFPNQYGNQSRTNYELKFYDIYTGEYVGDIKCKEKYSNSSLYPKFRAEAGSQTVYDIASICVIGDKLYACNYDDRDNRWLKIHCWDTPWSEPRTVFDENLGTDDRWGHKMTRYDEGGGKGRLMLANTHNFLMLNVDNGTVTRAKNSKGETYPKSWVNTNWTFGEVCAPAYMDWGWGERASEERVLMFSARKGDYPDLMDIQSMLWCLDWCIKIDNTGGFNAFKNSPLKQSYNMPCGEVVDFWDTKFLAVVDYADGTNRKGGHLKLITPDGTTAGNLWHYRDNNRLPQSKNLATNAGNIFEVATVVSRVINDGYTCELLVNVPWQGTALYRCDMPRPIDPRLNVDLVIAPKADLTGEEIVRYDLTSVWSHDNKAYALPQHPEGSIHEYKSVQARRMYHFRTTDLDHYRYNLSCLHNNNIWNSNVNHNPELNYNNYQSYDMAYRQLATDAVDNFSDEYTLSVTPVYKIHEDLNNGESATYVEGQTYTSKLSEPDPFPSSIGNMYVYAFKADDRDLWRVEFDFNRCNMDENPLPVNYFTIEYNDGSGWKQLENYLISWPGGGFIHSNNAHEIGDILNVIPGDYIFGGLGEEYNLKTRFNIPASPYYKPVSDYSSYKSRATADSRSESVAHCYTTINPYNTQYRAVAHYAANNPKLHRTVATANTPYPLDEGTTGVDDIMASISGLNVYPTPATADITVESPEPINKVTVHSLSGTRMMTVECDGTSVAKINVSSLPAGIYLVSVNNLAPVRMIKR